jgi:hypothetical protein
VEINMQPEIKTDAALVAELNHVNDLLRSAIGSSADEVRGSWRLERDKNGREVLDLTLSYQIGSASARFTRNELTSDYRMERRLWRLWDDVLSDLTDKRFARVQQVSSELEEMSRAHNSR